jgi:putative flippase GtrA
MAYSPFVLTLRTSRRVSFEAVRGLTGRWTAFNLVGLAGMAVQLATVALLVRVLGWHYLTATAFGVEAAVLHNFAWHQRWTWRDRPSSSWHETGSRLTRFHLLNGMVSLGGNIGLTALCTGALHIDAIWSNLIAIVACSLVNFAASESMVFASERSVMEATERVYDRANGESGVTYFSPLDLSARWWNTSSFCVVRRWLSMPLAVLVILIVAPTTLAAGPAPSTVAAWRAYEAGIDARYRAASSASSDQFFMLDRDGLDPGWRASVLRDGPSIVKVDVAPVSDGKIHHWIGAIFVPGVTVQAVIDRLEQRAGQESSSYEDVLASRLLERDGDRVRVFMKLRRTSVITVTYNTEHAVEYKRLTPTRASARSVATKIVELGDAGTPAEREKPPSDDSGYLWRLNAYWRYAAVPGGVIVECESVSLSRAVPFVIRPIANPVVDRIARESLNRTLVSVRTMLTSKSGQP